MTEVRGVQVKGRFLDDYGLDEEVSRTTRFRGVARFVHRGPACVGAVAFVVTDLSKPGHQFDRTAGKLTNFVIPLPRSR